ncbi:MAG TPA: hypothetical protein VJ647_06815 [Chitinophagaceae bacterium]|nr:hypothetical protein [Chitinophagaceae bacterium]
MKPLHSIILLLITISSSVFAQEDTIPVIPKDSLPPVKIAEDTALRITNLNPYITLHVDSTLSYKLDINKDQHSYYWFLRNAPVGLKINKDNGLLTFKADKSFFLSGKLKYDVEYKVSLGVQKLSNAKERVDTSLTLVFYNTEIIPSRVKPTVSSTIYVDEGDTVSFRVQCEDGNFPIEKLSTLTNVTIKDYVPVNNCGETFMWPIPFDFVKETDSARQRLMTVSFIGVNKFFVRDTATIKIYVKDALNYPLRLRENEQAVKDVKLYILQLKYAFRELDKTVKRAKNSRTSFDLASGTSALGGTVFSTMSDPSSKRTGTILPSVGVALIPVKEAVAPVKTAEQNSASMVRTSIRRLEYTLTETTLIGDHDPDILTKTKRLREELKQAQVQLIDVPVDTGDLSEAELNAYFNNPKVNRKYRTRRR